jgi:chromosome segregation ATPase
VARIEELEAHVARLEQGLQDAGNASTELEALRADRDAAAAERDELRAKLAADEERVGAWKEKVKAAKAADTARIEELEAHVARLEQGLQDASQSSDELRNSVISLNSLLARRVEETASLEGEVQELRRRYDGELSRAEKLSCCVEEQTSQKRAFEEKMLSWREKVKEVKDQDDRRIALLMSEISDLKLKLAELEAIKAIVEDSHTSYAQRIDQLSQRFEERILESEERCSELELKLDALSREKCGLEGQVRLHEERCELLRAELKRQREAFSKERTSTVSGATAKSTPSTGDNQVGPVLRAAAGGFETDMMSLAAQQSSRDVEIRRLQQRIALLEKQSKQYAAECEHNGKTIVQLTKELEAHKVDARRVQGVEYAKNIVLQFLCTPNEERRMLMVPAIATVLEFSSKEKQDVLHALPKCPKFV